MNTWHEYVGNIHMHTVHSDGTGTFDDLRAAARAAGLDFIITTDHNVLVEGQEGYQDGLLVLVGAEVHDENRHPTGNHLLCLGIRHNVVDRAADPQAVIDAVKEQGGLVFLAHPVERISRLLTDSYPWHNWEVNGYHGLELWNYMSEFRYYTINKPMALLLTYLPALFTTGPWPEALARWDELTQTRPVVAIGGSDVHARIYRIGLLRRRAFPYQHCFRAVNTHILTPTELSGDLAQDRTMVYQTLRNGHCWIGYDLIESTRGFRFTATSGDQQAIMGDRLALHSQVRFQVRLPAPADLRLLRNGQVIARARDRQLAFVTDEPGVYRVEAWRRYWLKPRGWIFSNPIYVANVLSADPKGFGNP